MNTFINIHGTKPRESQAFTRERNQIVVRVGKGRKDRVVPLSEKLIDALKEHMEGVIAREGIAPFDSDVATSDRFCCGPDGCPTIPESGVDEVTRKCTAHVF